MLERCEAPRHQTKCDGVARTVDHITPKCIGKLLGWSKAQLDDPMNLQRLSVPCHIAKDFSTPDKLQQLKFQLMGGYISFGEHK